MSMDNEVCQIDGEHALHDVLYIVCKYATGRDLYNMAQVCKSWECAVFQEKRKRCYFPQLRLLFPYALEIGNRTSMLDVIPSASLLIHDSALEILSKPFGCSIVESAENLLKNFKKQLPNKTIVLGVDDYLTTTRPLDVQGTEARQEQAEDFGNLYMLGLFFPSVEKQMFVHVGWCLNSPRYLGQKSNQDELVNQLYEELGLNDCKYAKSTMLMFTTGMMNDYFILGELYKRAQQNGKEVTFALSSGAKIRAGDSHSNQQSILVLRISGPTVESWATYINSYASPLDIRIKLRDLKEKAREKVKHGRSCIGLVFGPKCERLQCYHEDHPCGDSYELMRLVKITFPNIPFTGLFTKTYSNTYEKPEDFIFWQFKENYLLRKGNYSFWKRQTSVIIISLNPSTNV